MKQILLVEDNRAIYRVILEHSGFVVLEATDGEEGVRTAREEQPELILMDVSIPLLDGWEATRMLKADESTSDIPINAHALPADRAEAEEAGCDGYLAEPVGPRRVVEEVHRHLNDHALPSD